MTLQEGKAIHQKILDAMKTNTLQIQELVELTKPIKPECALGDLARFELMNDQKVYDERLFVAQNKKEKLKFALHRLEREPSIRCIDCDEEIPVKRLLALPEAEHCICCAKLL